MLRRVILLTALAAIALPIGCNTTESVVWSWPHNKRRLRKMADDFHKVHVDIDRIFFDMEEYPIEVEY